jgi:hypothetical protein
MSDGAGPGEAFQDVHVEYVGDQPHPLVLVNDTRFGNGNPGTLLTPMLQGIEPKVTHFGCIRVAERAKKTAGLAGFVVTDGFQVSCFRWFHDRLPCRR